MRSMTTQRRRERPEWTATWPSLIRESSYGKCWCSGCDGGERSGALERTPLGNPGSFFVPCTIELEALDLFDGARLGATGLANLGARETFHQLDIAVGEVERVDRPAVNDLHQRFVGDGYGEAARVERSKCASQARMHLAQGVFDGVFARPVVHDDVDQLQPMELLRRIQPPRQNHFVGNREAGLSNREVPRAHARKRVEQYLWKSSLRASLEDDLVK